MLGTQAGTHIVLKKMGEIEQQILSDPDAAKQLLAIMRAGPQKASKTREYLQLGKTIGAYWIGTKHYGPMAEFLSAPVAAGINRDAKGQRERKPESPKQYPLPTRRQPTLEELMQ